MRNPHQNRKEESQNISKSHAKKREEKTVVDVEVFHYIKFLPQKAQKYSTSKVDFLSL